MIWLRRGAACYAASLPSAAGRQSVRLTATTTTTAGLATTGPIATRTVTTGAIATRPIAAGPIATGTIAPRPITTGAVAARTIAGLSRTVTRALLIPLVAAVHLAGLNLIEAVDPLRL